MLTRPDPTRPAKIRQNRDPTRPDPTRGFIRPVDNSAPMSTVQFYHIASLVLLDLSAAFDTVDHSILLTRLQNWFGLDGLSLGWFSSYRSLRFQAFSINDSISAFSTPSCGVPQGSVLGPLLFTLYTTPRG